MTGTTTKPPSKNSWKAFLLAFAVVYLVGGVIVNIAFGPPAMSKEYLAQHKADHDRYVETIKTVEYKRWSQRPELNPPDDALAERFAFVDSYTARPEFIAEQKRRSTYDLIFDLFNVFMLIVLVTRFARTPLAGLLDGMIANIQSTLDRAQELRHAAMQRKTNAQSEIGALPEHQTELTAQTDQQVQEMRREAALSTGERLAVLNRETEDRQRYEETLARHELKREAIDQAIALLSERYRAQQGGEHDAELIGQFMRELGDRS